MGCRQKQFKQGPSGNWSILALQTRLTNISLKSRPTPTTTRHQWPHICKDSTTKLRLGKLASMKSTDCCRVRRKQLLGLTEYRPYRLLKHCALQLTPVIANIINKRVLLIDYSKAFDSVNHEILAVKLNAMPIPPFVLNWTIIFLTDRTQSVYSSSCQDER